ncbi:MAG: phenylacetic acid degradation operon negative regulatory protein PaaX [Woeseiaceae bacterium]|nr:phenylacetic acid degradation operon negative regulatory protein PaaX [Woeseiaceae bacterium]
MSLESACKELVKDFQSRPTLRAGSLITTVFGDSIAPRGGVVWLGSLINAMNDLGVNERLVRTSVFRLARDGWLQSDQVGRRSFYSLTDEGRERFEQATHRIYGEPVTEWDGRWTLVLLAGLDAAQKDVVRKELGWLGFGAMSANVLAHPVPDMADLDITLRRIGLADEVVVMSGQTIRSDAAMRRLAQASWNLGDIDERYREFVTMFRPLLSKARKARNVAPKTAFLLRTLLIQEYRKVLLRDPQLPAELLPANWHGTAAYQLCRNLYLELFAAAEDYLSSAMENADGPLPPASRQVLSRFGGLEAANG